MLLKEKFKNPSSVTENKGDKKTFWSRDANKKALTAN